MRYIIYRLNACFSGLYQFYAHSTSNINTAPCFTLKNHLMRNSKLCSRTRWFGFINWVDNMNWPLQRDWKLMFWALALCWSGVIHSDEGLTPEMSTFKSLYHGQFTLFTQVIKPNYFVILPTDTAPQFL